MAIQKNHSIAALALGVVEMVCGILIIILGAVVANKANVGANAGSWWAGLCFIIPGIAGIAVGITKNHGVMIAFMVLNIIGFVLQCVAAILAIVIIVLWGYAVSEIETRCDYKDYLDDGKGGCLCRYNDAGDTFEITGIKDCHDISSMFDVVIAMMVFLVIAAIVALSASILGCVAVCCTRNQSQPGVVLQPSNQQPPAYQQQQQPTKY